MAEDWKKYAPKLNPSVPSMDEVLPFFRDESKNEAATTETPEFRAYYAGLLENLKASGAPASVPAAAAFPGRHPLLMSQQLQQRPGGVAGGGKGRSGHGGGGLFSGRHSAGAISKASSTNISIVVILDVSKFVDELNAHDVTSEKLRALEAKAIQITPAPGLKITKSSDLVAAIGRSDNCAVVTEVIDITWSVVAPRASYFWLILRCAAALAHRWCSPRAPPCLRGRLLLMALTKSS